MDPNDPTAHLEEELDSEISSIRREIRKLQRRRLLLSSGILSSESLQKRLRGPQKGPGSILSDLNEDLSPLVRAAGSHTQSNHHRIAFSTTTFPFKDPSPSIDVEEDGAKNLLGVRIDICVRNGRFMKPYYLLLRKMRTDDQNGVRVRVRVHRHTIPAFIPVDRLARIFLPESHSVLGDSSGNRGSQPQPKEKQPRGRKQDLRAFVREVRRQLVAWHTRLDAVHYLRNKLGVIRRGVDLYPDEEEDGPWERDVPIDIDIDSGVVEETRLKKNDLGIVTLWPTALEAWYVRVEWEDGRVGRFKISNSGLVERAVVIGDGGRDKVLEAALTGGDGKVLTVLDRLIKDTLSSRDDDATLDLE